MVNKEEILRLAKQNYPIGTIFKFAVSGKTFVSNCEPYIDGNGIRLQSKGGNSVGWGYYNKWAEIISLPFKKTYELW